MKQIILVLILFTTSFTYAQTADHQAIEKVCYDYVEGFWTSDTVRLARALHPELAKRIVMRNQGDKLNGMEAKALINASKGFAKNRRDANPSEPFKLNVSIYDIAFETATVKIENNKMKFFDYAQLAKVNGEWKIINVLWAYTMTAKPN